MSKISVLTVFNRKDGEILVGKSLKKQSFSDFEWVQVCPFNNTMEIGKTIKIPEPKPLYGDVWNLSKAYNAGIKACSGDLIVSVQDEIWFPSDALEKFWFHYQENPITCVSGVGDKYERLNEFGKPELLIWSDPRKNFKHGSYFECWPNDWELNYASVPTKAMYDIGGFDETFDMFFGWDNVDVSIRLNYLGYKFFLDQSNESRSLNQTRPKDWEEKNAFSGNAERDQFKMETSFFHKLQADRAAGRYPYILEYI